MTGFAQAPTRTVFDAIFQKLIRSAYTFGSVTLFYTFMARFREWNVSRTQAEHFVFRSRNVNELTSKQNFVTPILTPESLLWALELDQGSIYIKSITIF